MLATCVSIAKDSYTHQFFLNSQIYLIRVRLKYHIGIIIEIKLNFTLNIEGLITAEYSTTVCRGRLLYIPVQRYADE